MVLVIHVYEMFGTSLHPWGKYEFCGHAMKTHCVYRSLRTLTNFGQCPSWHSIHNTLDAIQLIETGYMSLYLFIICCIKVWSSLIIEKCVSRNMNKIQLLIQTLKISLVFGSTVELFSSLIVLKLQNSNIHYI